MGTPNKTSSLFVLNGLDVYPSLYGLSLIHIFKTFCVLHRVNLAIEKRKLHMDGGIHIVVPVSYTHLDVYKRQLTIMIRS